MAQFIARHGLSGTRINQIHRAMKRRCLNPNCPEYKNYGGRGITICDDWLEFINFNSWAMANGYSKDLTIDRINNNGSYEPSNCRWADAITQANNTRTNHYLTHSGKTQSVADWARELNISPYTLGTRVSYGWSDEKILTYKFNSREKNCRMVNQFMLDGTFIKTHKSVTSAAREIGVAESHLCNVCKGNKQTAKGFIFRYVEAKEAHGINSNQV